MIIQPVILSGGSGTRLWPLSREHHPKQLLPLVGEDTLLQQTAQRLSGLEREATDGSEAVEVSPPLVVCNETHRYMVAEQLRLAGTPAASIVLEPTGRNTAPALTVAALETLAQGHDAVLLVMPADHVIGDRAAFHEAVRVGAALANNGRLVTFGIVADGPHTGYGYIQRGPALSAELGNAYELAGFVEKPDATTAERYVASGDYYWNSGMFLVKASQWMQQAERHCPDIATTCRAAHAGATSSGEFLQLPAEQFAACPSDSIDYAVMEKLSGSDDSGHGGQAAVVPLDAQWSDVGSWEALWDTSDKDERGNVVKGDVYTESCNNSLILAEHRFVGTIGLQDMVVVETADAVLVLPKTASQEVKKVVDRLREARRGEAETHRRVFRPWGTYEPLDQAARFQVKRIVVKPGAAISLQMHHHRAEHWIVVKGTARVTRDDESFLLSENQSTFIPLGTRHRLENPGLVPLEIIEVQSGGYLGEDDIVRFEDAYGRA